MLDGKEIITFESINIMRDNDLIVIVPLYDRGVTAFGEVECETLLDDIDLALLLKGEKFTSDEDPECRYVSDRNMIFPISDEYDNEEHPRLIRVKREQDVNTPMWCVTSNIPHATFTLYEEGEPYSMGIVIDLDEIEPIKM